MLERPSLCHVGSRASRGGWAMEHVTRQVIFYVNHKQGAREWGAGHQGCSG